MVARLLQRPRCLFSRLHLQQRQFRQQPGIAITSIQQEEEIKKNRKQACSAADY
jgi:hypothetical protein